MPVYGLNEAIFGKLYWFQHPGFEKYTEILEEVQKAIKGI